MSLGDFNNLEFDDDALVPPLDERLLPLPQLPLFFEGKDEMRENTEEEGGVKGGLLEELCLLSEDHGKLGKLKASWSPEIQMEVLLVVKSVQFVSHRGASSYQGRAFG